MDINHVSNVMGPDPPSDVFFFAIEAPELAPLANPLSTELTLKLLRVPNMPPEPGW